MVSQVLYTGLLLATGVERLIELRLSNRHAERALAQGGIESGQGHYPFMVALHSGFLVGAGAEVWGLDRPFVPLLGWSMLGLAAAAQALRWWCITTLGERWNTRVIVVPGLARVRSGPYRFFPHPNYVAVVVEGLALPLVHTAWLTAVSFSALNALLLTVRIRCENMALQAAP